MTDCVNCAYLRRENDFLRALVGNSDKECVYCGLGAENQAQCRAGFPGCARADDQMLCRNFGDAAALFDCQQENEKLKIVLAAQSREIELHQSHASTVPNVGS